MATVELVVGEPVGDELLQLDLDQVEHRVDVGRRACRRRWPARRRRRRPTAPSTRRRPGPAARGSRRTAGSTCRRRGTWLSDVERLAVGVLARAPTGSRGRGGPARCAADGTASGHDVGRRCAPASGRSPPAPAQAKRALHLGHDGRRGRRRPATATTIAAGRYQRSKNWRTSSAVMALTVSRSPAVSRPSGWSGNSDSYSSVWARSSGLSSSMSSSSRMTWRSLSTSASRSAGAVSTSPRISRPRPTAPRRQPRVVGRVLLRGEGVHVAADPVDRLGDLRGPSGPRCP